MSPRNVVYRLDAIGAANTMIASVPPAMVPGVHLHAFDDVAAAKRFFQASWCRIFCPPHIIVFAIKLPRPPDLPMPLPMGK